MAGNRQHHVWQMLQRGFGEKRGKDHHVWVYCKTKPAKPTATRKFGVEKYFYGPEGSDADSSITKYENRSQSTIQEIRKLKTGTEVDPSFVAVLIAHLEIRTAFLREDTSISMQKAVSGLTKRFRSPHELKAMLINHLKSNPEKLESVFGKKFSAPYQEADFEKNIHHMVQMIPDNAIIEKIMPILGQIDEATRNFPDIIKLEQNSALSLYAANQSRIHSHSKRKYSILRPAAGSLILPDTTLAFVKKQGASPFSQKGDDIDAVFLPIASDAVIIGTSNVTTNYSLKTINKLLAGCAFKAFLAKEHSPYFQGLTGRIGKYARLIKEQELSRMVREL